MKVISEDDAQSLADKLGCWITQDSGFNPCVCWHEKEPIANEHAEWWESSGSDGELRLRIESKRHWTERKWKPSSIA
jgi:hypothetical protein